MKLNKKMLVIALSISSCGLIMGMEEEIKNQDKPASKYVFLMRRTPENQARTLANFARTEHVVESDLTSALLTATWLMNKRSYITENNEWITFIETFTKKMAGSYCLCDCIQNKKLDAVINVVKQTTFNLQPGINCSQLLIDLAQEAMLKAEQEYNKNLIIK